MSAVAALPAGSQVWHEHRLKHLCSFIDVRDGGPADLPLLSVSIYRGVVPRSELTDRETRADDTSEYKRCKAGDIVINRMSAYQGAVGIAHVAGLISPEYLVLRANPDVEPRFLCHLIRSHWFVAEMASRVRGIGSTDQGNVRTPRINPDDLGGIPVRVPDLLRQRAIADYLDAEAASIDAVLSARLRQADLARERTDQVVKSVIYGGYGGGGLMARGGKRRKRWPPPGPAWEGPGRSPRV